MFHTFHIVWAQPDLPEHGSTSSPYKIALSSNSWGRSISCARIRAKQNECWMVGFAANCPPNWLSVRGRGWRCLWGTGGKWKPGAAVINWDKFDVGIGWSHSRPTCFSNLFGLLNWFRSTNQPQIKQVPTYSMQTDFEGDKRAASVSMTGNESKIVELTLVAYHWKKNLYGPVFQFWDTIFDSKCPKIGTESRRLLHILYLHVCGNSERKSHGYDTDGHMLLTSHVSIFKKKCVSIVKQASQTNQKVRF